MWYSACTLAQGVRYESDSMEARSAPRTQGIDFVNTEVIEETAEESSKATAPSPKWRERLHALRNNTPLLFRMVWEAAPRVVVGSLGARVIASLVPLAMLAVTGSIIEGIHAYTSHQRELQSE